ncbi:MAG: 50S ribosomal protein L10 [Rhodothermales bacterium]
MAMTKQQKGVMVDQITERLQASPTVYLTNYSGLTVAQANELRGRFRKAGVDFKVFKNTLVRLAMERMGGYDDLYDHLNGPTAVALAEEPAAPARVIKDFLSDKNIELPELKVAYIDGAIYQAGSLDILASLKSKDELIGDIIGLLMAPITNVVGALQAPAQTLAGAIQTIAEKEEA